jgi:regulatory protein
MLDQNAESDLSAAKRIAYRSLKFRPKSEKELRTKLEEKGITPATIQNVVELLKKQGLLDDKLFARGWTASRLRKPLGITRIRRELKQKGISDEIIAAETPEVTSSEELESALALAKKRLALYSRIPKLKIKQRLYGYLVRRGFRFETVTRVLNNLDQLC